jgi:hypothetical protein
VACGVCVYVCVCGAWRVGCVYVCVCAWRVGCVFMYVCLWCMACGVCVCVCVCVWCVACGVCVYVCVCCVVCVCVCQRIGHVTVTVTDVEEGMMGEIRGSCHCVGFEPEF